MHRVSTALRILPFIILLVVTIFSWGPARAQDGPERLVVGLYESPPFVMADGDGWTGMAVELWEDLAEDLGYSYDYVTFGSFAALVDETAAGNVDVAVSNTTVNEARHRKVPFTQPWFDAGLRLMVGTGGSTGFAALWQGLHDAGHLRAYGWLALVILVGTIAFTLFDRHTDPEFPGRWREGLAESFHTVMSITTSGKVPSRKNQWGWPGRIGQALWLVCGVAVLAYVTSTVTSVMTTLTLNGQISSIGDMTNRTSGVLRGSTAEDYARENGLRLVAFDTLAGAVAALEARKVDGIIGDAPVLEFFLQNHPAANARMTGAIFKPEKYAFGVTPASPDLRPLSIGITAAQERGEIEALRLKYFGPLQ